MTTLVERLRKIAVNLHIQADMARRVAETYAPERRKWEQQKGDEFLTAMVRYQVDQEQQARTLSREADDTEAAADRIEAQAEKIEKLREALEYYADRNNQCPNEGPWGVDSTDFGLVALKALGETK